MNPGQEIVKWLRPAGCVLVLLLSALALVTLFISGNDPVKGYHPPQTSAYYAQHPEALKVELEQNVFPALSGIESCRVTEEGKLLITLTGEGFAVARSALLRYYDKELFEFVIPTE